MYLNIVNPVDSCGVTKTLGLSLWPPPLRPSRTNYCTRPSMLPMPGPDVEIGQPGAARGPSINRSDKYRWIARADGRDSVSQLFHNILHQAVSRLPLLIH
jgi:hypothetical protein